MRRLFPALTLLFALLGSAGAQEARSPDTLTRLAMEAKLKIGDLLREKGDLDGALKAYGEAIALYESMGARGAEAPVEAPGATADVGAAIRQGLAWLAAHQDVAEDGKWDADGFHRHDPAGEACDGPGGALYDVGVTGLALLAFLGSDHTDREEGAQNPYGINVRAGLRYLISCQDDEGCFGGRAGQHFIYNHVCATLAMTEALARTRNPRYRAPAQHGVNFILLAQNPYLGWRYTPRSGESDTSVTGLCILALRAAEQAGLAVDKNAFLGALAWVVKMSDPEHGQVGYHTRGGQSARPEGQMERFPAEKSEAMTASGILTRIHCGENPRATPAIMKGVGRCLDRMPVWNRESGEIDLYYWYFATHALFHTGGNEWNRWVPRAVTALLAGQRSRAPGAAAFAGSWDPVDPWGPDGGRVYSTALAVLTLQIVDTRRAPAAR